MAFTITTFNMHGFSQGELILSHICDDLNYDIIFLQEIWLSPDQLYKLCTVSPNFISVGISAMEKTLSNSVLYGRPFGGVAILINNSYKDIMKIHVCSERFVIITLSDVAFVNVYLPNYRTDNDRQVVIDLLEEIKTNLIQVDYSYLVFGGDINWDPEKSSPIFTSLSSFNSDLGLVLCDNFLNEASNLVTHSFEQVKLGRYAYIDHFFVSLFHPFFKPVSLTTLTDYRNHSDHLPLVLCLNIDGAALVNSVIRPSSRVGNVLSQAVFEYRCNLNLNWECADLNLGLYTMSKLDVHLNQCYNR